MKPVGMDVHILNHFRLMQPRQNGPDPVHHVRRQLPGITLLEKPFQPPVFETRYHAFNVACSASLVNWNLNKLGGKSCLVHSRKWSLGPMARPLGLEFPGVLNTSSDEGMRDIIGLDRGKLIRGDHNFIGLFEANKRGIFFNFPRCEHGPFRPF